MTHLQWTPDLDTGIPVIDNQHKRIVEYINRFQDAITAQNQEEIRQLFDELVDYTLTHFTFEEDLQERAGYQFVSAHKRVHQVFTKKIGEYKARHEAGDQTVPAQVANVLRAWLVNHIRNDDADYIPAVRRIMDQEERSGWLARNLKRLFGG